MDISAYILLETRPGMNREAAKKMISIPGIISAYPVTGPYDVIAGVAFRHLENMTSIILPAIQAVSGVTKTITCIREDLP